MPSPQRRRPAQSPFPTPPPPIPSSSTTSIRQRRLDRRLLQDLPRRTHSELMVRDVIADEQEVEDAETRCQTFSDNTVFSCFPLSNTSIPQHQVASFVWNSRLPFFTGTQAVNIYLVDATSQQPLQTWRDVPNPTDRAGVLRFPVNDTWFGARGSQWHGQNTSFLFYWMVTNNEATFDSGQPQPIFSAVQTTFADSVAAAMSTSAAEASSRSAASASAASASSVAASLSSAAEATRTQTVSGATPGPSGTRSGSGTGASASATEGAGSIQSGSSSQPFPHWAIAVIVVLGLLALVASGILIFFIMRRLRNRRNGGLSHRGSVNSASPMMANAGNAQSPLLGAALAVGGGASQRPNSPDIHDGASTLSRGSEAAPFSTSDAAVMADAFRTALRKPNFGDRPFEEGESPDEPGDPPAPSRHELLTRELAEEGKDIRSVGSSRGVRVETLSDAADNDTIHHTDDGDTVQGHH